MAHLGRCDDGCARSHWGGGGLHDGAVEGGLAGRYGGGAHGAHGALHGGRRRQIGWGVEQKCNIPDPLGVSQTGAKLLLIIGC